MNNDLYWIWLSCGLGAGASCLDIVSYYEWNPYDIYTSSEKELCALGVLTEKRI